MSQSYPALGSTPLAPSSVQVPAIPLRSLAPWALFLVLLGTVVIVLAGIDLTMFGVPGGMMLHEVVHDGRHLLGYPCH